MNIKLKIGHRIKQMRTGMGISQEALANKAGLDRTYVTDVENGRRNISIQNLEKLILALNVSISDFFNSLMFQEWFNLINWNLNDPGLLIVQEGEMTLIIN